LYKNTSNPFNEILLDLKGGEGMSELKELVKKIEDMRNYLNDLLIEKGNLLDEEVILVSQALDKILNDYNEIISKM
jgi:DNA-binding PadR family transcriptional regulator